MLLDIAFYFAVALLVYAFTGVRKIVVFEVALAEGTDSSLEREG